MSFDKFQGHFLQKLFESVDVDDLVDDDYEEITIKEEILQEDDEQCFEYELQSSDYSDDDDQPVDKKAKRDYYIGRDKVTKWLKDPSYREHFSNLTVYVPSVTDYGNTAKSIMETWGLFFPEEMLTVIVENTNKYISKISSHSSRERDARPVDIIELKALIGLLYMSGLLRSSRLNVNELWDQNGFGVERFWLTMSKHRFLFLMRCVHFADVEMSNPDYALSQIREVMDIFIRKCQEMYNPCEFLTLGELLIPFRGSCPFKQYVPTKAKRYGIKMFCLVDSRIPYTKNLEIDVSQQVDGEYRIGIPDAKHIAERLVIPISGTNRNITCDKRFTSFDLISSMLKNHQLTTVAGIGKNREELPKEFLDANRSATSLYGYSSDTTIVSYFPEKGKNIIVASTMHDTTTSPKNPTSDEPDIVTFFKSTKGGVELVEQYCSTYDVSRFTKRWPMIVFFSFLNIGAINSYLIYLQNNSNEDLFRRAYLKQLAIALTQEHLKRRAMQKNVPPEVRQRRKEVAGIVDDEPRGDPSNPSVRKRCHFCKNRSKSRFFCKYCGKFICLKHSHFVCENCV